MYTNGMKTTKFTLCPGIARLLLAHRELEPKKAGSRENGVQRKIFRNKRPNFTETTFEKNSFTWFYTGKTPQTTIPTRFTLATRRQMHAGTWKPRRKTQQRQK